MLINTTLVVLMISQKNKNSPIEKLLKPTLMKTRNFTPMGALHPVLFFAGVYVVALLFSIFICSSLFYSCNASKTEVAEKQETPSKQQAYVSSVNSDLAIH